jgi:serine/threonine protein kinase
MECPDDACIADFFGGRLAEPELHALQLHLDGCPLCQEQVAVLASQTSFRATEPRAAASQSAPLAVGSELGDYRVVRLLGSGGMGNVYLAEDAKLGRSVAIKLVRPEVIGSSRAIALFEREARATAKFSHPNIVTVYGIGEHEGQPYVVLEHVAGESLRERSSAGRLPYDDAVRIMIDVCRGVAEAHRHGLLHRDLKPANVLLGVDGRVRVVDFGLAKMADDTSGEDGGAPHESHARGHETLTGTLIGTPAYMAPEQIAREPATRASDVWALGVMLYELLSGRRPFAATELDELACRICDPTPAPPLADAPREIAALVAACLEKDASRRPPIEEVLAVLERSLASRTMKRAPRLAIAAGIGGAIAGIVWFVMPTAPTPLIAEAAPLAAPELAVSTAEPSETSAPSASTPARIVASRPAAPAKSGSRDSCNPKYVVGKDGVRRYKPWCF